MATPRSGFTATMSQDQYAARTVVSSDAPGTWTHPRMQEIHKRLRASTFDEANVRSIIFNSVALVVTFIVPRILGRVSWIVSLGHHFGPLPEYLVLLTHLVPLYNIVRACMPLLRRSDDLSDIPLTPKQRSLLGLPASSTPASPGSTYITPPRYSRSATPRSDSSSRSASPYSGSRGASPIGTSGYSPSPLFQRAINRDVNRKLSFGNPPSPNASLGQSMSFGASSMSLNPPSPAGRVGASAGLTNRWLYERGRRSSSGMR